MTRNPTSTLFALLALLPASVLAADAIDETRPMPANGQIQVDNLAGSVEMTTWEREEIHIGGFLGDDVEEIEISEISDGIRIRVRNDPNRRDIDGTELELRIPAGASVEVEGVSADISLEGGAGEVVAFTTVSGDLALSSSPQRMELNTVSGDVEFTGAVSRSSISTVSGDIEVEGAGGEVSISTVSGDVSMDAQAVSRARFESVSGELNISTELENSGRLNIDTMSGDVVLRLPQGQQAEFTAQSYSGDIHSDFGEVQRVTHGPGSLLEHREGENGATIRLESFSGDIHIRRN
jgi:DUF4097 and DUF4098 domain-containing protein YvlB